MNNQHFRLSVIIPTYNNASEIETCLTAICAQHDFLLNHDYEVIVVDDGSTDETARIVQQFPVRHIQHKENLGRITARQTGVSAAQAEQLLFLDARVVVQHDFLKTRHRLPPYPAVLAGGQELAPASANPLSSALWHARQVYYGRHLFPTPRTSHWITPDNFARSPKGLGAFFITQSLWRSIQPSSVNPEANDDTALLHNLVFQQHLPIWRSRHLKWQYHARTSWWQTFHWIFERGHKFANFYLKTPLQQWLLLLASLLFGITLLLIVSFPQIFAMSIVLSSIALLIALMWFRLPLLRLLPTTIILPLLSLFFFAGMVKHSWQQHRNVWGILIIGTVLSWFLITQGEIITLITSIQFWPLLTLVPLTMLFYLSNGLFLRTILQLYTVPLTVGKATALATQSSLVNLFLPARAGLSWRALYLKNQHSFPYRHFAMIILANYLLVFQINSLAGLLALLWLPLSNTFSTWLTVGSLAAIWGVTLVSLFLPRQLQQLPGHQFLPQRLQQAWQGWSRLLKQPHVWLQLVALTLINLILSTSSIILEARALGFALPQWQQLPGWLLIVSLGSLSLLLSLTPAALGIREGLYALGSQWVGLTPAQLVAISLVDRGIHFIAMVGVVALSWRAMKK